ncbi:MAG: SDR family oxidoreductase [Chromatiales bacterium]|jgi:NAD(P)-dependent dehydrogenase (short-subunit alcohol dehydrogenase family)|nr:SDR family oxidoreductase [Chromatiales bacterium]
MNVAELFSMKGERVLVTGASSGLGEHFARVLAAAGADVALAARRLDACEALADEIRAMGRNAVSIQMDVCDSDSVQEGIDRAVDQLGDVSVLINNAGVTETVGFVEQSKESWDRIIDTNLNGAWAVARATAAHMTGGGAGGNIINIASVMSFRVAGHLAAYCTSKGALLQLTRAMGLELARHGVRVNALAPGYIATPFNAEYFATGAGQKIIDRIPQRRLGEVADLDGAILLLASKASTYMTSTVVHVDGGHVQSSL